MEYLSISQVAEKWGIKQRRIRRLCEEGRIPGAHKMGAYQTVLYARWCWYRKDMDCN